MNSNGGGVFLGEKQTANQWKIERESEVAFRNQSDELELSTKPLDFSMGYKPACQNPYAAFTACFAKAASISYTHTHDIYIIQTLSLPLSFDRAKSKLASYLKTWNSLPRCSTL